MVKVQATESRLVAARAGGGENGESLFHETRFSVWRDKNSSGGGWLWRLQNNGKYLEPLNYILLNG